ncbi:hypothetical protein, partial [Streptomyces albidoflavus]|uniref:hypothetical protein n=1 Tax=Streptomyces albidoflavus TaxID=1886 RepID=UPI00339FAFE0
NAPSAYDVIAQPANRSRAEARWNYVLDGMVKDSRETSPRREARRSREGGVRRSSSDPALTEPAW